MNVKVTPTLCLDQLPLIEGEMKDRDTKTKNMTKREKQKYLNDKIREQVEANSISKESV